MKSFRVLLPLLAQFFGQVAASQAGPSLLDACDDLSIEHSDGVLSGKCHGTGDAVQTSVDLDECLAWGPRAAHLGLRGYRAGLAPEKDGAFTDYCGPCYIINRGELNQEAAHLFCNCGPDDSDISTEYSFDLGSLVTVTDEGCLECMGATGDCIRDAPSWTSRDASAESDLGRE